ncbi:unnamed protein product [Zymoseptoria tritici ST99CH_3D7]|uniref:Uncharacterized protein n=1 Tax=Zymoseptoria tritici (strain ST99CH_3D7) TaxID=1276538 RepID=A0A1X7S656_ZYMT9|nr:unnamed protein product [Zymoseptoria tritici ST99CH_3D7]
MELRRYSTYRAESGRRFYDPTAVLVQFKNFVKSQPFRRRSTTQATLCATVTTSPPGALEGQPDKPLQLQGRGSITDQVAGSGDSARPRHHSATRNKLGQTV